MNPKVKAKASVIIRFSNRSAARVGNLKALIRHISRNPNLEIIVSCMEKDVDLREFRDLQKGIPGRAKLIHLFDPRPFASTTANNLGAAKANTDIFIFQDADILFNNSAYDEIIKKIGSGKESVRIGEDCLNLNPENTKKLLKKYTSKWKTSPVEPLLEMKKKLGKKGSRDAPGAASAISRKAYADIGGMCELFQLYGWEDCYFRYKVKQLKHVSLKMPMVHLYHEVNYQSGYQKENSGLYSAIISANKEKYKIIIERDREALFATYPTLRCEK